MKKIMLILGAVVGVLVLLGGTATAASQITARQLATGSADHRVIQNGAVHNSDLTGRLSRLVHEKSTVPGPKGAKGDSGLAGAYYAKAVYDNGGNGWATVSCDNQSDVAISGGVEAGDSADNSGPVGSYVIASFPGRMDWTGDEGHGKNTPRTNRLDGWVIGMHADADGNSDNPLVVWALCVPGANVGSSVNHY